MTPSQFHRTILQADHFKTCIIGGPLLPWPKEAVLWSRSRHWTWISGHRVCLDKEVGAYSWQIYSPSWLKWGQALDCLSHQGVVFSSPLPLQKDHYSVRTYTHSNTEILEPTCPITWWRRFWKMTTKEIFHVRKNQACSTMLIKDFEETQYKTSV